MSLHLAAILVAEVAGAIVPTPEDHGQSAGNEADYYTALCSLAGEWSGEMEQYEGGKVVRAFPFELELECLAGTPFVMETNTFHLNGGDPMRTFRVIFPIEESQKMHMSYFFAGIEKVFFYEPKSVDFKSDKNWTIVRQSIPSKETDEAIPSGSRYTHSRNGDNLTMLRETSSDAGAENWRLSSKLTLSRIP